MCLSFEVAVSVDKLLKQDFSMFGRNILVIPCVDKIPIKKLVPYHQVLVTFSYNTPGSNLLNSPSALDEIKCMYLFFSKYGNVVDLNLELMPSCLVVTYTRHESVLNILAKSMYFQFFTNEFRNTGLQQHSSRKVHSESAQNELCAFCEKLPKL